MSYDSDDIAEKLRSLKGSDYEDFDQEDLDKMYRSSMVEPSKITEGWTADQRNSYRQMYGEDALYKADNEVNYGKYGNMEGNGYGDEATMKSLFGDGGVKNFRTGKLTEEQQMWDKAREDAGIKKVNSMSDIAEIRDKVNREMMGRMTGLGMSAMAKDNDIAEPASVTKDPEIVTSQTFQNAKEITEGYEEDRGSFGSKMTKGFKPPKMTGGPKDINEETGKPNDKSYLDKYKLNLGNKMKPTNPDGSPRPSMFDNMRKSPMNDEESKESSYV